MSIEIGSTLRANRESPKQVIWAGSTLLAVPMVLAGVLHMLHGPAVAQMVPAWIPWRLFWAYICGACLIASGLSFVAQRYTRLAAYLLGFMLLLFVLLIHVPSLYHSIMLSPGHFRELWSYDGTGGINNALKDLALTAAATLLGAICSKREREPRQQAFVTIPAAVFATVLILFGAEHFFYTRYTPAIPTWQLVTFWYPWLAFWGYCTGAVLLVGGVSLLTGKRRVLTAGVLGWMILAVAVISYAFRALAGQGSVGELMNTAKDIGVGGGVFLFAILPGGQKPANQDPKTVEANASMS